MMQEKQLCPVCLKNGRKSYLKSYQMNLEEGIWLCEYKKCIYPLGEESEPTFKRQLDALPSERDTQPRVPSAQLALQINVANRLTECHQKIQNDVIGIQTGSPLFMKTLGKQRRLKQNGVRRIGMNNAVKLATTGIGANGLAKSFKSSPTLTQSTDSKSESENSFPGLSLGLNKDGMKKNSVNGHSKLVDLVAKSRPGLQICRSLDLNVNGCDYSGSETSASLSNGHIQNGCQKTTDTCPENECKPQSLTVNSRSESKKSCFLQWKNKDALCWLDVVLCLLVHNKLLNQLIDNEELVPKDQQLGYSQETSLNNSLIRKLIKAHKQASTLFTENVSLNGTSNGTNIQCNGSSSQSEQSQQNIHHKTQGDGKTVTTTCTQQVYQPGNRYAQLNRNCTAQSNGQTINAIRDEVWSFVQKKIKCEKGKPSSPVLAIPALLQSEAAVEGLFRSKYKFTYSCPHCKFVEDTDCESVLPSLPAVVKDFNIIRPVHKKKCLNCSYTKGKRKMIYKSLPQSFMMHFLDGLPSGGSWSSLEFRRGNIPFTVTGVVQYKRNPDHFVAWLRNPQDNTWVQCDDLKSPVCLVREESPRFSWKQIHIVMWERAESIPETLPSNFGETLKQMKGISVNDERGVAPEGWTNGTNGSKKDVNEAVKVDTLVDSSSKNNGDILRHPQKCNGFGAENGTGHFTLRNSNISVASSVRSSVLAPNKLCSSMPKSDYARNELDLSVSNNCMADSRQQISNDSQRFLKSSTTTTTSSIGRSACSSISSTCSELSDNVSLPEFVSSAQLGIGLIKPVPCRNDSPVQNTEFSDRNVSEADPNSEATGYANCNSLSIGRVKTLTSDAKLCDKVKFTFANSGHHLIPNIQASSVFCPLQVSKSDVLSKQKLKTLPDDTKKHILLKPPKVQPSLVNKLKPQAGQEKKLKTINNDDIFPSDDKEDKKMDDKEDVENVSNTVVKHEPKDVFDPKDKQSFRFKLPGLLRPKSKPSKISRDAFKTLKNTEARDDSESKNTPSVLLGTGSNGKSTSSYLTAVKQYLIDKTTDKSHFKAKFEGLNLKSAPHLNHGIDLSGLRRNDFDASPDASRSGESTPKKSEVSFASDNLYNRKRHLVSTDTNPKRSKTALNSSTSLSKTSNLLHASASKLVTISDKHGQIERAPPTNGQTSRTASVSKLSTFSEKNKQSDRTLPANGHNARIGSVSKQPTFSEKFNQIETSLPTKANKARDTSITRELGNVGGTAVNLFVQPLHNNKENGILFQSQQKTGTETESESVLQDLYDALNIPFTSIKETMPNIMEDVDDIFGSIDMSDLDPCQPCKTENLQSSFGNQGQLDCQQSVMKRFMPESSNPLERQKLWSPCHLRLFS